MLHRLSLTQSWLLKPEEGFQPCYADISWQEGVFHLRAEVTDKEVLTTASSHGERLWEHGDVIELFFQRIGESNYREYQVSPNGFTLALHYPDISCVASVRRGERRMQEFLVGEIPKAEVSLTHEGWILSLSIPLPAAPGERLRVSCCRYDAGTGRAPIISSTSPHPVRDFHRPQDWREMILMEE
jgi:hypothetical protein